MLRPGEGTIWIRPNLGGLIGLVHYPDRLVPSTRRGRGGGLSLRLIRNNRGRGRCGDGRNYQGGKR